MQIKNDENSINNSKKISKLQRKIKRLSWFPSYQTFSEIGLKGSRDDTYRYRFINFEECKNKIVVDFGCNLGQTCTKAYFAGSKRIIGIDCQKDTIRMAKEISSILNTNIEFYVINFNHKNYQQELIDILENERTDISFFLSIYRTKELKDREGLFNFVIKMTKEIIFFEGHADPGIDKHEYYSEIFKNYHINYEFLGYTLKNARPFYMIFPKH